MEPWLQNRLRPAEKYWPGESPKNLLDMNLRTPSVDLRNALAQSGPGHENKVRQQRICHGEKYSVTEHYVSAEEHCLIGQVLK